MVGNEATGDRGGALCIESSILVLSSASQIEVANNRALLAGGAFALLSRNVLNIAGPPSALGPMTFRYNSAISGPGGAIFCFGATLNVQLGGGVGSVIFEDNTALSADAAARGGALSASICSVTMRTVTLRNNSASNRGGAVFCEGSDVAGVGSVAIRNAMVNANVAARGGAICVQNCVLEADGVTLEDNKAVQLGDPALGALPPTGGAIALESARAVRLNATILRGNRAVEGNGGALWHNDGERRALGFSFDVSADSLIEENEADDGGGALFWDSPRANLAPPVFPASAVGAGNRAKYGNVSATPAYQLLLTRNTLGDYQQRSRELLRGELELEERDYFGSVVVTDSASVVTVSSNATLLGSFQRRFERGVVRFAESFAIEARPGVSHALQLIAAVGAPEMLLVALEPCAPGESADQELATCCVPCASGRFSPQANVNASACAACPAGRFANATGLSAYSPRPACDPGPTALH
jgi:predicted outer membrane repeat protein